MTEWLAAFFGAWGIHCPARNMLRIGMEEISIPFVSFRAILAESPAFGCLSGLSPIRRQYLTPPMGIPVGSVTGTVRLPPQKLGDAGST
jgi:hypothetical protein